MELIKIADSKHKELLQAIYDDYPIIEKTTTLFNKTQSQFMDSMLTLSQLTPLRSARQCTAEIKKSRLALEEALFKMQKLEVEIKLLQEKKAECSPLENELYDIEIAEKRTQIKNITENAQGAIRRIAHYIAQYKNILKKVGKETFTEEDFERDEERYHIMTVFSQALNAARSNGGVVDNGNFIYFFQIGISGTAAQIEIGKFFKQEEAYLKRNELPPFEHTLDWLDSMAEKYSGCAQKYAEYKSVETINEQSLITA